MVSIKLVTCLALLFSVALAAPSGRGRIINIVDEFVPVSLHQSESAEFALERSEVGRGRLVRTGISVTRGATAVLNFDVRVKAIDSSRLNSMDVEFQETLNSTELVEYTRLKQAFRGNLNIPFLAWLGANLDKRVTREDLDRAAASQTNYAAKASAAEKILEDASETNIRITGTLEATGVSFIPSRAVAFIRLATVMFENGESQLVVSSNEDDLGAFDSRGRELPSPEGGKRLNIIA